MYVCVHTWAVCMRMHACVGRHRGLAVMWYWGVGASVLALSPAMWPEVSFRGVCHHPGPGSSGETLLWLCSEIHSHDQYEEPCYKEHVCVVLESSPDFPSVVLLCWGGIRAVDAIVVVAACWGWPPRVWHEGLL